MSIRLWKRDYMILQQCYWNPHSSSQIAMEHFTSKKKASERLKRLFDAKLLDRFPGLCLFARGKAEYIYVTSKRGEKELKDWNTNDIL